MKSFVLALGFLIAEVSSSELGHLEAWVLAAGEPRRKVFPIATEVGPTLQGQFPNPTQLCSR